MPTGYESLRVSVHNLRDLYDLPTSGLRKPTRGLRVVYASLRGVYELPTKAYEDSTNCPGNYIEVYEVSKLSTKAYDLPTQAYERSMSCL